MKIYDISQEIFSCAVYPGDREPRSIQDARMDWGDSYNLTSFEMCAHNGTHLDAPRHVFRDGATVAEIPLEKTVGPCWVTRQEGDLDGEVAREILRAAGNAGRILIRGRGVVTEAAAGVFARAGIDLLGVEGQTVGPEEDPMAVHRILLGANVVILEGIRLDTVPEGPYLLNAAPLCLSESDGAPCRAILMTTDA